MPSLGELGRDELLPPPQSPATAPRWLQDLAEKLGIDPARAQSGGWFRYGDVTGLRSPPKTIVNLLNDQVAETARVIDVPPEKAAEWWFKRQIPLAGVAGAAAVGANDEEPLDALRDRIRASLSPQE